MFYYDITGRLKAQKHSKKGEGYKRLLMLKLFYGVLCVRCKPRILCVISINFNKYVGIPYSYE